MNANQRKLLIGVAAAVLGMLLYPPFYKKQSEGRIFGMGYDWIFSPPDYGALINVSVLVVQWLGVLIVGGITFVLLKDK